MEFTIESRDSVRILNPQKPYVVISITEPQCHFTHVPMHDKYCKGVLAIKFCDIEEEIIDPRTGDRYLPISDIQAQLIYNFIESQKDWIELVIVNCDAGVSRSSATAAALSLIYNQDDKWVFNSNRFLPNRLVYRKILNAAGLTNDYPEES